MTRAADLDVPLDILSAVESETDEGGVRRDWEDKGRLWAAVRPLGGREQIVADGTQAIVTHEVTFRADPRVTPKDRLRDAGTGAEYHVEAISTSERARFHVARCRALQPAAGA